MLWVLHMSTFNLDYCKLAEWRNERFYENIPKHFNFACTKTCKAHEKRHSMNIAERNCLI